jgi:large subunit ribosomal protein L29
MKTEDLRTKTLSELKDLLIKTKKEAMNLRFQKVAGRLESPAHVKVVRRAVARIKTLMTETTRNKS